jgi:hypothetical protein
MMKSDRELLELAAKAAGYVVLDGWDGKSLSVDASGYGPQSDWNPLTNDGDALRLAVKLRITIDSNDCCAWSRGHFGLIQEFWGGDYDPCYRRAIVRAAAEIGASK